MKITLVEVPTPMMTEFTLFAEPKLDLLKEKKVIRVVASPETKTRVSTTIQFGNFRAKVNFAMEGFKTHHEEGYSMFGGNKQVSDFFVKSKKQDIEAYKKYVLLVVEHVIKNIFKIELDELTIELEAGKF